MTANDNGAFKRAALWLTALGYLPFIILALALLANVGFPLGREMLILMLTGYGAVILSFLGGIRWGMAIINGKSGTTLVLSVLPSLLGWIALIMEPRAGLIALIIGITLHYVWDRASVGDGGYPAWFARIRTAITVAVVFALALAIASGP